MSNSSYSTDSGGNSQGFQGENHGIVNQQFNNNKSEVEIHDRTLIKGSPYLGLKKFKDRDKDKFFGRKQLIADFSRNLETSNLLLLIGASGIGKSSLVQAGIIPSLFDKLGASNLEKLIFVPDINPFESLYKSVPIECRDIDTKIDPKNNDALIKFINNLKEYSPQWIIFIDQFEEIFTRTPKPQRKQFIKNLVSLIKEQDSSVKLIMTMRYDFMVNIGNCGDFNNQLQNKICQIGYMSEPELELAIAKPAAINGVTFENDLVEKIIRDFKKQAGSLPLLQYTLDLLWQESNISDENRVLRTANYNDLGGVSGALEKQANNIYNKELKNDKEKKAAKQIFIELIDLVDKEPVSRRIKKSELINEDKFRKSALNTLIDNRLLVSGTGESTTVEVAHEELLRSWSIIQTLIEEQREIILIRSRLNSDANQWYELRKQNEEKAKDELWSGYKLQQALELIDEQVLGSLDENSKQFIQESRDWRDRQKKQEEERSQRELEQIKKEKNLALKLNRIAFSSLTIVTLLTLGLGIQQQRTLLGEIGALADSSEALFSSNRRLDALLEGISAGKKLNWLFLFKDLGEREVVKTLPNIVNNIREKNNLEGHKGLVRGVSFSPNGQFLATASKDNTVKIWSSNGRLLCTLEGHKDLVGGVIFSPNGQFLAAASEDNTVKIWDMSFFDSQKQQCSQTDNKLLADLSGQQGHIDSFYDVAISPDSQIIALAGQDGTIKLWKRNSTGQFETQPSLEGHTGRVYSVAFSPNGKMLASAGQDGTVKLWKRNSTGQFETQSSLEGHTDVILSVAFSPNGKMLASADQDGTIKLWKWNDSMGQFKTQSSLEGHTGVILSVAFSPNGKMLASAGQDRTIKLWKQDSTGQFEKQPSLEGHTGWVYSVAFSPNGQMLASAGQDRTIKLWNFPENEPQTLVGHEKGVWSVAFSPNLKIIATGSEDKTIKLWDLKGEILQTLPPPDDNYFTVRAVAFSPDGQILASAGDYTTILLWKRNDSTGKFEKQPDQILNKGSYKAYSVAFSRDGQILASASQDGTIKLWKRDSTGQFETQPDQILNADQTLKGTPQENSVTFSPKDKILALAGYDGTIKLWKWNDSTVQFETQPDQILEGHDGVVREVAFSLDSNTIVTAGEDTIILLWKRNDSTGKFETQPDKTLMGHTGWVNSVAFSPDSDLNNQIFASASEDGTVKLWNLKGEELLTLYNPFYEENDWFRSIAFSPDGKTIVAGGTSTIMWRNIDELKLDKLMVSACNWVGDYLQYSKDIEEKSDRHLCDGIGN